MNGAKSAGVSSTWDRLQGGSAMSHDDRSQSVGVGGVGAGIGATDVELDDGSGMAWLKRRKEEKQRKAREQKEKEEKEAEKESLHRSPTMETIVGVGGSPYSSSRPIEIATTPHIPPAIDVSPPPLELKGGEETATKYSFPTPKPKEGGETSQLLHPTTHENERVLQAINVPVRSRPTHHRSGSKGSRDLSFSAEVPQVQVAGSPILVSPSGDDNNNDTTVAPAVVLDTSVASIVGIDDDNKPALVPSSSFSSSSESEDDGDGDDEVDEEDEEEEQEEELQQRNALRSAAGVEKISRHNKE